ncbi:MAG: hypothetical protein PHW10_03320 [Candidatus Peribacteraceae bacterium]|nr:hypothetical protein [Candidatus Peribacteraceae bacterium]
MARSPFEPSDASPDGFDSQPMRLSLADLLERLLLQEYDDAQGEAYADVEDAWVVSGTCYVTVRPRDSESDPF